MEVEVLAPAGSLAGLIAAVNAGADAIYIGGQKYGARAYAKNPEKDELIEGIEYAHHFGVKVYMTLNTLLKEEEMKGLYEYVLPYYEAGVDALIVQDLGVMKFVMIHFPKVDIHASTQMSIMGYEAATKLWKMGVSRVVPAREVSMEEIRNIRKNSDIEIEGFVHGALCYSYSGQCFMSSLIGGRSANRGRCAGTCRLPFEASKNGEKLNKANENYLLSCKDLCSLDILPDVLHTGVNSLKIEGRMKSPRYTAGVVRIWRKYVDLFLEKGTEGYQVDPKDRKELLDLYDRGGQTDGYYEKHNGKDMLAIGEKPFRKDTNGALFDFLDTNYVNVIKKHKIRGRIFLREGEPISLTVSLQENLKNKENFDLEITVNTEAPSIAQKNATVEADIRKQMKKTGNTFFEFEELTIDMEPNLFVPVKFLNELRRAALENLNRAILERHHRKADENRLQCEAKAGINSRDFLGNIQKTRSVGLQTLHLCAETKEQLEGIKECLQSHFQNEGSLKEKSSKLQESMHGLSANTSRKTVNYKISFEGDTLSPKFWKEKVLEFQRLNARVYLYLPHIFRLEARAFFKKNENELLNAGFDGFIIRSLEESEFLKRKFHEANLPCPSLHFDYNMYAYNTYAKKMNQKLGADMQTLAVELNLRELKVLGGAGMEAIVYGRLPMMVSAQCIKKTTKGCDHVPEVLYLKDRQNVKMPVKNKCTFCYNHIYNAKPLSTLGISRSIMRLGVESVRLLFTTEDKFETLRIAKMYEKVYFKEVQLDESMELYTRGHYKRGIE